MIFVIANIYILFSNPFSYKKYFGIPLPILFVLLHLMPLWIYLVAVIGFFKEYAKTYYILTDYAVYISGNFYPEAFKRKPFAEISHAEIHAGFFRLIGVGNVVFLSKIPNSFYRYNISRETNISDIRDYRQVYDLILNSKLIGYSDNQSFNNFEHNYAPAQKGKVDFQKEFFNKLDK